MNILLVSSEIGNGGGGLSLSCEKLYDLLSQIGDVQLVSPTSYPILVSDGGYSKNITTAVRNEYKLKEDCIMHSGADVVIGFGGGFNGYYAALLSNRINARYILCLRGSDVNLCKWDIEQKWLVSEACKKANHIVCLSNEMIENVAELSSSFVKKTLIIPNFYSISPKQIVFPNYPRKIVIGCASSHLNEKKGIANIFQMAASFRLISSIPLYIELAGSIDEDLKKQYQKSAQELTISDRVNYLGYVSRERLPEIMGGWDFYVQGSVCEGHPNIIMECISLGRAFISTRTGFIAEKLSNDFPSLFFNSSSPQQMATQLLSTINDKDIEHTYFAAFDKITQYCLEEEVRPKWEKLVSINSNPANELPIDNIISIGLHDIQGEEHDSITTPIDVFQQFVNFIHSQGHSLCSMKDYLQKNANDRKSCIVCTFDDGYESMLKNALPILSKYGYTATVFICTSLIGKDNSWNNKDNKRRRHLTSEEMLALQKEGWEIGSHGVTHRNLLKLDDTELSNELIRSQEDLQKICDCNIQTYAYPYGASNPFIQSCVSKYYKYAFSVDKGGSSLVSDRYQIRRYSISEIYNMLCEK